MIMWYTHSSCPKPWHDYDISIDIIDDEVCHREYGQAQGLSEGDEEAVRRSTQPDIIKRARCDSQARQRPRRYPLVHESVQGGLNQMAPPLSRLVQVAEMLRLQREYRRQTHRRWRLHPQMERHQDPRFPVPYLRYAGDQVLVSGHPLPDRKQHPVLPSRYRAGSLMYSRFWPYPFHQGVIPHDVLPRVRDPHHRDPVPISECRRGLSYRVFIPRSWTVIRIQITYAPTVLTRMSPSLNSY